MPIIGKNILVVFTVVTLSLITSDLRPGIGFFITGSKILHITSKLVVGLHTSS